MTEKGSGRLKINDIIITELTKNTSRFSSNSAYSKICMYTYCLQDNVFCFWILDQRARSMTSGLLPVSSGLLWTSAATSIPDISLSVIAIDKREGNEKTVTKGLQHAATMLTSYALYSLFTCTWHYARSIHRFPLLCFWIISQMVYQMYGCLSGVCKPAFLGFFCFFFKCGLA